MDRDDGEIGVVAPINDAALSLLIAREPAEHPESIPEPDQPTFNGSQFIAYLSDFKYNRRGEAVLQLTVPHEFRHMVRGLDDVFGLPCVVDMREWDISKDAREELDNA